MSWANADRIHHVSCSMHSHAAEDGIDSGSDFERVEKLSRRLSDYARKLGFDVMYENVDRDDGAVGR